MILLEMRNLLPECCQFVTFLSLLVAAQHGAPLSPGPSSWLWAQVWTRRDCFAAPVGHFTISFSLRNFKKPSRPHYLCTSFRAAAMWLSSGKAAAGVPAVEREKRVTLLGAGTWDTGRRGSGSQASLAQQALIWHLLCVSDYARPRGQRSIRGGLWLQRAHSSMIEMEK